MNTCKSSYWHRERLPFVWKTRKFQGELNWNGSYRWKLSGKKVIPFGILPFPRFYRNDRNFLCHLFESAPRSKSRESKKVTGICKWYNSISILFLVPKKIPVPFVGNFSPKVSAEGNGSKHVSLLWKTGRRQKNIKRGAFFDSCRRYLRFKSALHLIPLSIQLCIFLFIKFVLRQSPCRALH